MRDNNKTVTSPFEIANAFNNYFLNVAQNTQSSIKYSAKEFHEFLPPLNINSFLLSPTDKNEIVSIISVLDYFPTILKTSKVTPIYKKDSKLECSNYRPYPYYVTLIKSLNPMIAKFLLIFRKLLIPLIMKFLPKS